MHLDSRFGKTYKAINIKKIPFVSKINLLQVDDSHWSVARATGLGVRKVANVLKKFNPKLMVVLGDRFEILGASVAALLMNVPIAHIHGGEATEGAVDDQIRHAISKMSALHFPSSKFYRQRLIQMGEDPKKIFFCGALAVDNIHEIPKLTRHQIEKKLDRSIAPPLFLVTYHPVTLREKNDKSTVQSLTDALDYFPNASIVITGVNADAGHNVIKKHMEAYAAANPGRVSLHKSLGEDLYINLMRQASAVIGNSSTGFYHAPILGIPTINIGDRQKGRIRLPSIVDVDEKKKSIVKGLTRVLRKNFKSTFKNPKNPFGKPGVADKIVTVIKNIKAGSLRRKPFFELKW